MAATAPHEDPRGHLELLRLLAQGLSTDHILELMPRTTRTAIAAAAQAGMQAILAIETQAAAPSRRRQRERKWTEQQLEIRREHPRNWEPWDEVEDAVLTESFTAGTSVEDIASDHGRTLGAIQRRLAKLGLIEESGGSNDDTSAAAAAQGVTGPAREGR